MKKMRWIRLAAFAAAIAMIVAACTSSPSGEGNAGGNDIAGTVTGPSGPEAGV